tara:strand:- start:7 stop:1812 length:1806 start_codon:yes stop_codon:yes gene_type:complete
MALTAPTNKLEGNTIATTYDQLLFLDNADGLSENSLKVVSTNVGKSALQIDDEKILVQGVDTNNSALFNVKNVAGNSLLKVDASTPAIVINEDSQDMDFRIEGNGEVNLLYIDAGNDRIGIGTATPSTSFEIQDGLTTTGAVLTLSTKEASVVTSDVLGRINFQAPLDTGLDSDLVGASIAAISEATFSDSVNSTALHFQTADSETATTKMVINKDGEVGIGTESPASQLHIGGTNPQIRIGDDGAEDTSLCFMGNAQDFHIALDDTTDDLTIGTGTTIGSNQLVVIENGGNVGIGTTTPSSLLTVHNNSSTGTSAIQISARNDGISTLLFGETDSPDPNGGAIEYRHVSYATAADRDKMLFRTADSYIMAIDGSNGLVGMGTVTPSSHLEVAASNSHPFISVYQYNSAAGDTGIRFGGKDANTSDSDNSDFVYAFGMDRSEDTLVMCYQSGGCTHMSSGQIFSVNTSGVFVGNGSADISDQRLKKDITDLSNPLATINALRGTTFKWIDENEPSGIQYGLIAQEVESVVPDLVLESSFRQLNADGTLFKGDNLEETMSVDEAKAARNLTNTKTVNMNGVIPILIEAVKELSAKVTALENA